MIDLTLPALWRAGVEVLILTVGIYYVYIFVRGTRGAPVVTGFLIVVLALTALALSLDLAVLKHLLRNLAAVFLPVAVLVLFQPELRRMLGRLGNLPVFATVQQERETVEVLVQASIRMAEKRIGALIAIEQAIDLREAVESGVNIDCEATPEMLETLFFPNNALHDGGVIMEGDRIAYAACIFPLSQSPDLNPSLGTRHRAAVGLSEETDAIVIAVSEETSLISYAHRGELTRGVTEEELRSFLSSVLVKKARSTRLAKRIGATMSSNQTVSAPIQAKEVSE